MSYFPGALIVVPALAEILISIEDHHYVWMILCFSNPNVIITRLKC